MSGHLTGAPRGVRTTSKVAGFGVGGLVEAERERLGGAMKLLFIIVLPICMAVGGAVVVSKYVAEKVYGMQKEVLLSVPMQDVNWQGFGYVFEPLVNLPVKTTAGFEKHEFLLDSGAVVSSLPREWAEKTGHNLAFAPRTTFRGFGGTTSLAYHGEMTVKLGEKEEQLPVVFTEAAGTKSLLGRKGFFEEYSIYFNHKERRIEIRS